MNLLRRRAPDRPDRDEQRYARTVQQLEAVANTVQQAAEDLAVVVASLREEDLTTLQGEDI